MQYVLHTRQQELQEADQAMIRETCRHDEAVEPFRRIFDAARRRVLLSPEQQLLQVQPRRSRAAVVRRCRVVARRGGVSLHARCFVP